MRSIMIGTGLVWIAILPLRAAESAADKAPAGIYYAAEIAASPKLTAAGLVWWKDQLIIADRGGKELLTYIPGGKCESFKKMTNPVGVAVDPERRLVVTEKDGVNRIVRLKADRAEEVLAEGEGVQTPHFIAAHRKGMLYWSGFPDAGTRSLAPGGKPVIHTPKIGHTYGIALSPKQDWLYVSSKLPNPDGRAVWRFPVDPEGQLGKGEIFFKVKDLSPRLEGLPEPKDGAQSLLGWVGRLQGITVDRLGHIYIAGAESHTSGEAVAVIAPDGKKVVAMILGVPRNISCMAFGGKDGRTLFISGAGSYRLYQVQLPVSGW